MAEAEPALVHGFTLDGAGGASSCLFEDLPQVALTSPTWLHFDFTKADTQSWIRDNRAIPSVIADALLDEDSRPRVLEHGDGVFVALRGVNHNPGEDLDDMVSIRLWISRDRIISTRRRRLLSVRSIAEDLRAGNGPVSITGILLQLVLRLNERIDTVLDDINGDIEQAEISYSGAGSVDYRGEFAQLRRKAMRIRRWLAPQRSALEALSRSATAVLTDSDKVQLREEADQLTRFLEELDLVRERAMVAQEELIAQLAQEQNSRMYILSLVAAVFLPLSFITGLMGMNVAGMPGTVDPRAFFLLVVAMVAAGFGILALFKWRKWL